MRRVAKDIQMGNPDTTVEIDEAYIGGRLRHQGSKMAQAAKTMVIGMAEIARHAANTLRPASPDQMIQCILFRWNYSYPRSSLMLALSR